MASSNWYNGSISDKHTVRSHATAKYEIMQRNITEKSRQHFKHMPDYGTVNMKSNPSDKERKPIDFKL